MIQFVAVAAVGAVGIYAYSSFKKHMAALQKQEEDKKAAAKHPKTVGDLEHDPDTGRYRVKQDDVSDKSEP